jgi:hypothetical protein
LIGLSFQPLSEYVQFLTIDAYTREFHLSDGWHTGAFELRHVQQSRMFKLRKQGLSQGEEDGCVLGGIGHLCRGERVMAPFTYLFVFVELLSKEMSNEVSQAMTTAVQACVQKLGSEHGIEDGTMDSEMRLTEEWEIKFRVMEDFER